MLYIQIPIQERYAKISGYDSYYITEFGDVYTYRQGKTGWNGFRKMSLRGKNNKKRYLQVCLCKNGSKKYVQVHRLVATYFCSGYFEGAVVNHKDGDIHNNRYNNLEWISQRENIIKSYITSGVNQVRNYGYYSLLSPSGEILGEFVGRKNAFRFLKEHNLDASASSLEKYGKSRGYRLFKVNSHQKARTTIRKEYPCGETPQAGKCQPPTIQGEDIVYSL